MESVEDILAQWLPTQEGSTVAGTVEPFADSHPDPGETVDNILRRWETRESDGHANGAADSLIADPLQLPQFGESLDYLFRECLSSYAAVAEDN